MELTKNEAVSMALNQQNLRGGCCEPLKAIRRLICIQAQYPATPWQALYACCRLSPDRFKDSLYEKRALVRTWNLRGTVHLFAASLIDVLVSAFGREEYARYTRFMEQRRGISPNQLATMQASILHTLRGNTLTRKEIQATVPRLEHLSGKAWGLDVKGLALRGEVVFAKPRGNSPCFARTDDWWPGRKIELLPEDEALVEVLARFINGYGPVSLPDFAHWTGLAQKRCRPLLEALAGEVTAVQVAGLPGTCYLSREHLAGGSYKRETLRLLPKFDPLLLAYKPQRLVPPAYRHLVYRPAAQIEAVVLYGTEAIATWRAASKGRRLIVSVYPFKRLTPDAYDLLAVEVEEFGHIQGYERTEVEING